MRELLQGLVREMGRLSNIGVIPWACPVPVFGNFEESKVATVGLNPSNLEFLDPHGMPLTLMSARFPTLSMLGIDDWSAANAHHLGIIENYCRNYFLRNPYNRWFQQLDQLLEESHFSYYDESRSACHLDLVPYATSNKWGVLPSGVRRELLHSSRLTLARMLVAATIQVLVLNGKSVVHEFSRSTGIRLSELSNDAWSLPRMRGAPVRGLCYFAHVRSIRDFDLGRDLLILGFNHNIQSSYGVTRKVRESIGNWVSQNIRELGL